MFLINFLRLKSAKIIPMSAAHSGLITKSDAERLCSIFLDGTPPLASLSGFRAKSSPFSFRVQHFCFGSCIGILLPEAYTRWEDICQWEEPRWSIMKFPPFFLQFSIKKTTEVQQLFLNHFSPSARCIECIECEGLFCPQKFVCHAHRNRERRTCHWGFDSVNWRSYLMLAEDYSQAQRDSLSKSFADFKARYNPAKRKQVGSLIWIQFVTILSDNEKARIPTTIFLAVNGASYNSIQTRWPNSCVISSSIAYQLDRLLLHLVCLFASQK